MKQLTTTDLDKGERMKFKSITQTVELETLNSQVEGRILQRCEKVIDLYLGIVRTNLKMVYYKVRLSDGRGIVKLFAGNFLDSKLKEVPKYRRVRVFKSTYSTPEGIRTRSNVQYSSGRSI